VAELAASLFISNDKINVAGIVLAGSAEFKNKLHESDLFDPRLQASIIKVVDVSYGGENGFNQAIELSAESLANVKFVQEKKLLAAYFSEISRDTGKFCFGVADTLKALELGSVETVIVWENLAINRYLLKVPGEEEKTEVKYFTEEQEADPKNFSDAQGQELEVVDKISLVEWLANHFKDFGAKLQFVSNRSQEGSQFVKGFGGIGGLLRYQVDFQELDDVDDEDGSFM